MGAERDESSLNMVLNSLSTQFFVRCDGDDILHSNYFAEIEKQIELIIKQNRICGIAPSFRIIEQNKADISYTYSDNFISKKFLESAGDILATGMFLSVDKIKKIGSYQDDIINSGLESYELCLRMLDNQYSLLTSNSIIFSYRRHKQSTSQRRESEISKNGQIINEKYLLGRYERGLHHPYLIS